MREPAKPVGRCIISWGAVVALVLGIAGCAPGNATRTTLTISAGGRTVTASAYKSVSAWPEGKTINVQLGGQSLVFETNRVLLDGRVVRDNLPTELNWFQVEAAEKTITIRAGGPGQDELHFTIDPSGE